MPHLKISFGKRVQFSNQKVHMLEGFVTHIQHSQVSQHGCFPSEIRYIGRWVERERERDIYISP